MKMRRTENRKQSKGEARKQVKVRSKIGEVSLWSVRSLLFCSNLFLFFFSSFSLVFALELVFIRQGKRTQQKRKRRRARRRRRWEEERRRRRGEDRREKRRERGRREEGGGERVRVSWMVKRAVIGVFFPQKKWFKLRVLQGPKINNVPRWKRGTNV